MDCRKEIINVQSHFFKQFNWVGMRSDIENRATYFRIVYYKLDSWIWEMFFESVLDEYNTTLFTGLWLIIMIKRVLHKEHLIYVIENGMENICWCNCDIQKI